MWKYLLTCTLIIFGVTMAQAQDKAKPKLISPTQTFALETGLFLLENPFVLYPTVQLSYAKKLWGNAKNQIAILPQLGAIFLPGIETKILLSTSLQYRFVGRRRLEATAHLGINYQLRQLAYDRYAFQENVLVNKGRSLHQVGPKAGLSVGFKIINKTKYSVCPFIGLSITKLNKSYVQSLFAGYKPAISLGIGVNY